MMGKDDCEIKCTETVEGFNIELKGKGIKECFEACKSGRAFSCCTPGKEE